MKKKMKTQDKNSQNVRETLKEMKKGFKQLAIPFTDREGKIHTEDLCRA